MIERTDADSEPYLESFLSSAFGAGAGDFEATASRTADLDELPDRVGPYIVAERIGHGGMGQVFRVLDPTLGREVAIKVIREHLVDDPAVVQRFKAEAKLCSQLQHPGVVPIHEMGMTDDGRPYFTMKVIEGRTLDRILRDMEPEQRGEILSTFGRICDTLAYAHSHGVVHGDMKPQNIMVGAFGEVQVMDWGFAREVGDSPSSDRPSRGLGEVRVFGTPSYMAPEQALGDGAEIDARTDVFGLGAVLCEILSGEPPYRGATRAETFLQASHGWLSRAHDNMLASGCDPALVALAMECLSPQADDRPSDAAEVADRVRAHVASAEDRARRSELRAAEARAIAQQEQRARRLTIALAISVFAAVIVPAAIYLKWSSDRRARQATTGQAIAAAMARARVLILHAASAAPGDLEPWTAAQSAAGEAAALAAMRDVDAGQADEVDALVRELELGRASAVRDQTMVDQLLLLRPHGIVSNPRALEAGYQEAFREYGLDFEVLGEAAAVEGIVLSAISRDLIHALDEWVLLRRHHKVGPPDSWRLLLDTACDSDPEPWRTEVRYAFRDERVDWLRAQVDLPELAERPLESMRLLARLLAEIGEREAAIRVYRMATIRHPEDYWLTHDLASQLGLLRPAPTDEMVRLYSMAAAVRPKSEHALVDLGRAMLLDADRIEENTEEAIRNGVQVLRRAIDLDPSDGRSHAMYAIGLIRMGQLEDAEASLLRAQELGFKGIGNDLSSVQLRQGHFDDALTTLRTFAFTPREEPVRRIMLADLLIQDYEIAAAMDVVDALFADNPDDASGHWFLALCLLERGDFAGAEEALERAVAAPGANTQPWASRVEGARHSLTVAELLAPEIQRGVDPRLGNVTEAVAVGQVAMRMGHYYTAFRFYERLLDDPTDPVGLFAALEGVEAAVRVARGAWDPGVPADGAEQTRARPVAIELAATLLDRVESARDANTYDLFCVLRRLEKNPEIMAERAAHPDDWEALERRWRAIRESLQTEL